MQAHLVFEDLVLADGLVTAACILNPTRNPAKG